MHSRDKALQLLNLPTTASTDEVKAAVAQVKAAVAQYELQIRAEGQERKMTVI